MVGEGEHISIGAVSKKGKEMPLGKPHSIDADMYTNKQMSGKGLPAPHDLLPGAMARSLLRRGLSASQLEEKKTLLFLYLQPPKSPQVH
jgi:hypothetical protein